MQQRTLTTQHWTQLDFTQLDNLTILYCRLSAEDGNDGESNSIANQKLILTQFAEKMELSNLVTFEDDGYSGSNFNRPAISKALELVEAGKVRNFIVKDLSRLGRDYLKTGQLLEFVFPARNVRFLSVNEQVDSAKASSQDAYMLPLVNLFNEWYSRQCSEKIRLSKRTKAKNGEKIGWQAPYGYLNHSDNSKEWVVDEVASKVIQRIFSEFVSGKTPSQIAKRLRQDNIRTPRFHKKHLGLKTCSAKVSDEFLWNASQIVKILDSEEYIGSTVSLKTEKKSHKMRQCSHKPKSDWLVFKNQHPAIVEPDIFETVQKMRQHKRTIQRHKWKDQIGHENTFEGLVYCVNGHKLTFCPSQKGEVNLDHYKCSHYHRVLKECSHGHYVRKRDLEALVLADLQDLVESVHADKVAFEESLKRQFEDYSQKSLLASKRQLKGMEERIQHLDTIMANLYEDKVAGTLSIDRFEKLSKKYEAEQSQLSEKTTKLKATLFAHNDHKHNVEKFLKLVDKFPLIERLTPEIVNQFINKITLTKIEGNRRNRKVHVEIQYNFIPKTTTERD